MKRPATNRHAASLARMSNMFKPAVQAGRVIERGIDGSVISRPATHNVMGDGFQPSTRTMIGPTAADMALAWRAKKEGHIVVTTSGGGSPWTLYGGSAPQEGEVAASRHNSPTIIARINGGHLFVVNSNTFELMNEGQIMTVDGVAYGVLFSAPLHDIGSGDRVAPQGHGFPGVTYNGTAGTNSVGAGFGEDCDDSNPCNAGMFCTFGTCVGIPLPASPICGANAHLNGLDCECDTGYHPGGNGCVPLPIQTGSGEASCVAHGGKWAPPFAAGDPGSCQCPSGQNWDGSGCVGAPDTAEAACQAGGGTWDANTQTCTCNLQGQVFSNGSCGPGCVDGLGNNGTLDANGNCVGITCGSGQGRGSQTDVCMDCGINGRMADGIHCNICPPGSKYTQSTDSCDCAPGKKWNAANTACEKGATGNVNPPPPPGNKTPPVTCAPGDSPIMSAAGITTACAKPPPASKSGGGSSNGLLIGLAILGTLGAGALLLSNNKGKGKGKSKKSRHAHA